MSEYLVVWCGTGLAVGGQITHEPIEFLERMFGSFDVPFHYRYAVTIYDQWSGDRLLAESQDGWVPPYTAGFDWLPCPGREV